MMHALNKYFFDTYKYTKKTIFLLFGLILFLSACDKNDDCGYDDNNFQSVALNSEVNKFIWNGLNYWYYWQEDVTDLADTKNDNIDDFYTYLNSYNTAEDLFDALKYTAKDDFSWYIEDVAEQLNDFKGISKSFGFGLGKLVEVNGSDNVVIYITYVVPKSPASDTGLKRGDIIYKVDGIVMDKNNYLVINNVFKNENITLGFATVSEDDTITPTVEKTLSAAVLTTNPVHYSKIINRGGKKIGYLVYNGFRSTFNGELNDVFGMFKSANIDELILDFRYNGGGSVLTSALLASMINGGADAGNNDVIFAKLQYNAKRNYDNSDIYPFFNEVYIYDKTTGKYERETTMNRLNNINKLYVITTDRTASASEMIINGLRPYMDVITIGEKTVGKNEGSITVVDAAKGNNRDPYTDTDNRSSKHTIGMQPIVFQIFNAQNTNDYNDGFIPKIEVEEHKYYKNIRPFGDTNEALLRTALNDILGGVSAKYESTLKPEDVSVIEDGIIYPKFTEEMYIMPEDVKPQQQ